MSFRDFAKHRLTSDVTRRQPEGVEIEVAAVSSEPIGVGEVQDYLRITHSDEDILISMLIEGVREQVERRTGRLLTQRQVTAEWTAWWTVGHLPYPPVASVTSVERVDSDGATATVDAADYTLSGNELVVDDSPGDGLRVVYDAGYSDLPMSLKMQMLRDIRARYDHRDGLGDGSALPDVSAYDQWTYHGA